MPIDVKSKERRRYRANVFLHNKRGSTKSIQEVPRNDKGRYDEKDMKWVTNDELVVCLRFSIHEEAPLIISAMTIYLATDTHLLLKSEDRGENEPSLA